VTNPGYTCALSVHSAAATSERNLVRYLTIQCRR